MHGNSRRPCPRRRCIWRSLGGLAPRPRPAARRAKAGRLIRAVRYGDDAAVEQAVLQLSRSRRLFAPLALGARRRATLFDGVKLLVTNWRLTLVQVLPAMWIWLAMLDLKAHALRGKSFHVVHGPVVIPLVLAVAAITAACCFLNAVFAFAIARPGPPVIRPRVHPGPVQPRRGPGMGRRGRPVPRRVHGGAGPLGSWWFAISLSIVIAVMMVCYVAVPARLIGMKTTHSKRDKLTLTAVGGAISAVACTPPYALTPGRPAASGQLRRCRARKHQARRMRPTRSPPALSYVLSSRFD